MFMKKERILFALLFAFLFAGVALVAVQPAVQAAPAAQESQPVSDCKVCHQEFYQSWQNGPHGQATTDPVFNQAWTEQGKPGACLVCHTTGFDPATGTWLADGVACEACHSPVNANHPQEPMPVDKSTELCGKCHSDTRFSWDEWEVSSHYQRNMTCSICHDAHTAAIRTTQNRTGQSSYDDASTLCVTCHTEAQMNFPFSSHYQKGLTCIDCHLNHLETQERQAHTIPDHSFNANLTSCNTCHVSEMHGPEAGSANAEPAGQVQTMGLQLPATTPEPNPVSPVGFAVLAGLVGLAAGMVLSPWLERFYHTLSKRIHKEESGAEDE